MNRTDKDTLEALLRELCSAQDDVTHWNEKGQGYVQRVRDAQAKRTAIHQRIVAFVDARVRE